MSAVFQFSQLYLIHVFGDQRTNFTWYDVSRRYNNSGSDRPMFKFILHSLEYLPVGNVQLQSRVSSVMVDVFVHWLNSDLVVVINVYQNH